MLVKIQQGIDFFKANHDYKKADLYLNRFEYLRQTALEKLNVRVIRVLRELNASNNLRVVQSNVFETASRISEIDVKKLIFGLPTQENSNTLVWLMDTLRSQSHIAEYAKLRNDIFAEYFENRKYLLESYLHSLARIFEKDAVKASEFLGAFLAKYLELISEEQNYFKKQFPSEEDFS